MSDGTPKWTPDQAAAIRHVDGALLLSAAAGSGKTAVLAARCVHLVCDAPPPCDVDELLVLTFTRAAAAEMRERIDRELRKRVAAAPAEDERLQRQLRLLDRASITTLDAFCGNLVRSHFHLVGVDPAFAVLAPEDAALLRDDVCNAILEAAYDSPRADAFKRLLDAYFGGEDASLCEQIIDAHNLMQSIVDPARWIEDSVAALTAGDRGAPSELARRFAAIQERAATAGARALEAAATAADRHEGLAAYAAHARQLATELAERAALAHASDFDALATRVAYWEKPRLPTVKKETPGKDQVQKQINKVKEEMGPGGDLHGPFRWTWAQLAADLAPIRESAAFFFDLVREFGEAYARAKRSARSLDFADTEVFALRILRAPGEPLSPSPAALDLQQRYRHVLVDEYQDINPLQDAILRLASRDVAAERFDETRSNFFAVGDVKQSIYRFRLAEPRQFVTRADKLRAAGNTLGRVIDLQANFRSRPPLLEAANEVFRLLMTKESAGIGYDATHELRSPGAYPAAGAPAFAGRPIEFHLLPSESRPGGQKDGEETDEAEPDESDRFEREVDFVARRIKAMVCADESRRPRVIEKTDAGPVGRPIRFGDIAVLLRSARHKASVVADGLRDAGVPVHADDTTGFFNATEVQDVLTLLRVLSNRRQDIPMAASLRSPLLSIPRPDDALALVRVAYADEPFHRAVARYAAEYEDDLALSLKGACATLDRWRVETQDRPIVDALERILDETGYRTFCRALPGGAQRVANLDELLARAAQFDTFERQGLDRFLRFLHELEASDAIGRPAIADGATDVVRVLTVHKSKGLEFPVVIVPDLGKRFNEQSLGGSVLIDRDVGIGMTAVDLHKRIRYPSAASSVVRDHARRQALAEEIRVLYVAMTRAREHLILVGTGDADLVDRWRDAWAEHEGPLPDDAVQAARTPLDWLGPIAAIVERRGLGTFDLRVGGAIDESDAEATDPECAPDDAQARIDDWLHRARVARVPDAPDLAATAAVKRLTFAYPHEAAARQPATRAVTDTLEGLQAAMRREPTAAEDAPADLAALPWPQAYDPPARPPATEIGAATHRLLQSLDFAGPLDELGVRSQIAAFIARRAMTEREASLVDVDAIVWLGASEVGALMRSAGARVIRERSLAIGERMKGGTPGDLVLVRGRVDAMVIEADGTLTLIDYKTDRIHRAEVESRAAVYAPQLEAYADALAKIIGRPVARALAVFLTPRQVVDVLAPPTPRPPAPVLTPADFPASLFPDPSASE